jgi:acetylornithine deacetylase
VSDLRDLLERLVAIDSVNPALDPDRAGETEIARFVRDWAEARGLETIWLEPVAGRPSVLVRAPGRGGGRTLMLNAHLDTVGVAGMAAPFAPRVEDGRVYGRGAMDMKASLAACLLAAAEAARRGDLPGDVVVTAVADEEHDSIGTRAALEAVTADVAVITEPTDLTLHVAHRGFAVVEVELTGRASHTSRPDHGVNALRQLGRLMAAVERLDEELREREPHPLLGHGGWQPVLASGGRELFTTPDRATVALERRTLPGEDAAHGAAAEIAAVLQRLADEDATLRPTVRTTVAREAFEADPDGPAVTAVERAAERVLGRTPERRGAPYWTDAALVDAAGIPTVLFGPVGGGIHQPDEWLDLASAERVLDVVRALVEDVCGGMPSPDGGEREPAPAPGA